jgi:hypothetical protein
MLVHRRFQALAWARLHVWPGQRATFGALARLRLRLTGLASRAHADGRSSAEIRCYMRDPDGYMIEVDQSTGLLEGRLAKKRPEDLPG